MSVVRLPFWSLLIGIAVLGIIFGAILLVKRVHQVEGLISRVVALNGGISVDGDMVSGPTEIYFSLPPAPPLVSDDDLEDLEPYFASLSAIEYIDLTGCSVTDVGIQSIVDTCFGRLEQIDLSGTKVTDKALSILTACPNMSTLSISGSLLSADGIKSLAQMPKLAKLNLYGVKEDDERIEKLNTPEYPNLVVEIRQE